MSFLNDAGDLESIPADRWARLKPSKHRGYPPAYHRKWFPLLAAHPDPTVTTVDGYVWVVTPWKVQSVWSDDLEVTSDRPEQVW